VATGADFDDLIIDGLTSYVGISNDSGDIQEGAAAYRQVADALRAAAPLGEKCRLAFPSMVIRPDVRTQCFVAIFESAVVVAWRKGAFRKRVELESLPLRSVTKARAEVSTASSTRGALLMTIDGSTTVTFALPQGRDDIAEGIRAALGAT
jgi:hypothetical protein